MVRPGHAVTRLSTHKTGRLVIFKHVSPLALEDWACAERPPMRGPPSPRVGASPWRHPHLDGRWYPICRRSLPDILSSLNSSAPSLRLTAAAVWLSVDPASVDGWETIMKPGNCRVTAAIRLGVRVLETEMP